MGSCGGTAQMCYNSLTIAVAWTLSVNDGKTYRRQSKMDLLIANPVLDICRFLRIYGEICAT